MKWKSIEQLSADIRAGKTTAVELAEAALKRAKEVEEYNALITVIEDAVDRAKEVDAAIKAGELDDSPLAGIPYVAKDNYLTKGVRTTAASNILSNFVPEFSSTVIEKINQAGGVLIAKANHDAFAHGSSNENSDFGPVLNPHDKTRVPGGSSGGVAAAVELGIVPFGLGSDTGGSIRQPASFTGTVGYKPTYGLTSRYGVVAMISSTDTMGPIASSAQDCATVLEVISGRDENDSTTIERDQHAYTDLDSSLKGKKIGVIKEYLGEGVAPAVKESIETAASAAKEQGAEVVEVSIPNIENALPAYYIIMPAEVSSNLSRYDGIRYGATQEGKDLEDVYIQSRTKGFNDENKRRIMMGTYVLSSGYYDAYYKKAQAVRTLLIQEFEKVFVDVDFLIGPTAPTTAFELGRNTEDPLEMYLADIMTVAVSLVGVPAISIPSGKDEDSLPIGLQVIAPQRHDRELLGIASGFESVLGYES